MVMTTYDLIYLYYGFLLTPIVAFLIIIICIGYLFCKRPKKLKIGDLEIEGMTVADIEKMLRLYAKIETSKQDKDA